jgi:hypothetical protein
MLLRSATRNCGHNIGPLFKIMAAKFQDAKFRALTHSGSGNGPLPLLRVQLRPLPPLFITLVWIDHGCTWNKGHVSLLSKMGTKVLFIRLIIRTFQLVISARTVFFSHNKSANRVFQPAYQHSRTGPNSLKVPKIVCWLSRQSLYIYIVQTMTA